MNSWYDNGIIIVIIPPSLIWLVQATIWYSCGQLELILQKEDVLLFDNHFTCLKQQKQTSQLLVGTSALWLTQQKAIKLCQRNKHSTIRLRCMECDTSLQGATKNFRQFCINLLQEAWATMLHGMYVWSCQWCHNISSLDNPSLGFPAKSSERSRATAVKFKLQSHQDRWRTLLHASVVCAVVISLIGCPTACHLSHLYTVLIRSADVTNFWNNLAPLSSLSDSRGISEFMEGANASFVRIIWEALLNKYTEWGRLRGTAVPEETDDIFTCPSTSYDHHTAIY